MHLHHKIMLSVHLEKFQVIFQNLQLYICKYYIYFIILNKGVYDTGDLNKTFTDLPPHYSLSMNVDIWALYTWDLVKNKITIILDFTFKLYLINFLIE